MTHDDLSKLTPQQRRIRIAGLVGWSLCGKCSHWHSPLTGEIGELPDYLADLNAMNEAIQSLPTSARDLFNDTLVDSLCASVDSTDLSDLDAAINATAAQRATAFLLAVG